MISPRTYTVRIDANLGKVEKIEEVLYHLKDLSETVCKATGYDWKDQKTLYNTFNKKAEGFPLYSKVIQQFLKLYGQSEKGGNKPKTPIRPMIILDPQMFDLQVKPECKFSSLFLRIKFLGINVPLKGKYIFEKIPDFTKIKFIRIRHGRLGRLYADIVYNFEYPDPIPTHKTKCVGLDINSNNITLSTGKIFWMTERVHRSKESRKRNSPSKKFSDYSKNFLHKFCNSIVDELVSKKAEVLVLEDLKFDFDNLTSKNWRKVQQARDINFTLRHIPYGQLRDFLVYKCLVRGIRVVFVDPAYTSLTCNVCGSLNTERPRQDIFLCHDCGAHMHADLNGAKNIRLRYLNSISTSGQKMGCKRTDLPSPSRKGKLPALAVE